MSPKKYIIQEIDETLNYIQLSTPKFDNHYFITFDTDLLTFIISIKGKLSKSLKQGIHLKFNKLMIYKGIVFPYIFIYNVKEEIDETKKS